MRQSIESHLGEEMGKGSAKSSEYLTISNKATMEGQGKAKKREFRD